LKYTKELIVSYINKFPTLGNQSLAKKILEDNKEHYTNIDQIRKMIIYHRKKQGISFKNYFEERFGLKESFNEEYIKYEIQRSNNRILILSDIHIPYHDPDAISEALKYGKDKNMDTIILNGDIIDFYMLSSFEQDPRKRSPKQEIDQLRSFLENLRDCFYNSLIIFKFGNHEERWERYLKSHAPRLFDMDEFRLEIILRLEELNIIPVKDKRVIKCGHLNIIHGHEYRSGFGMPVNPVRWFLLKAKTNIIGGHWHRSTEEISQDIQGKYIGGWSTGCLCGIHPEYRPLNEWTKGFAFIEKNQDDTFSVFNEKLLK